MSYDLERNIQITDKKLNNIDSEVCSRAHRKRMMDGFILIQKYIPHKKAKILDIGCRTGNMLELFYDYMCENLYGIDISERAVKMTSDHINAVVGDAHNLKFESDFFDIVIIAHTLEHCKDPKRVIDEIYRVLKNSGYLYIEIPLEKKDRPFVGHFSHFTSKKRLFKLLKGFDIIDDVEDYKLNKKSYKNGIIKKKRRWLRVIAKKIDGRYDNTLVS